MSKTNENAPSNRLKKLVGTIARLRLTGWIVNFPPIAWVARVAGRSIARHKIDHSSVEETPVDQAVTVGLEAALQQIVHDVVTSLGYAGAMVATYEQGDVLPVRAIYVNPSLATMRQIRKWEKDISQYSEQPVSITDPAIARVFVYQDMYKNNLSVRAFKAGGIIVSDELYDLFTPIVPLSARSVVKGIQQALGIRQVIAIPFFLEISVDGQIERESVGNLFVAKQSEISKQDRLILSAFGRQVAAAIESERRRLHIEVTQEIIFAMQSKLQYEEQILQQIVEGLVSDLGYVGAMVATFESDNSLPVRAFYIDPGLATEEQIHQWENEIAQYSAHMVSINDPDIARVFVYEDEYEDNLSVRAFKTGSIVISDELYDLFRPITPAASRPVVKGIQQVLGIQQVIAVPFFLETFAGAQFTREIVGNLFVVTQSKRFSDGELKLLKMFGQQAAAGIRNARLYYQVEERRQVAQVFGKMAFSAAASVHALRNHIGTFQMHLILIRSLPPEQQDQILSISDKILKQLDEAMELLDHLHEPWHATIEVPTDVNACIRKALGRVIQDGEEIRVHEGIVSRALMAEDLPTMKTSPDMLIEAFRVLLKNALEAIREKGKGGELKIESRLAPNAIVEVLISDTGIGVKPMNLSKIFEMRWSTKKGAGMGFGLFWTKEYIEGAGGTIEVESVWEEGTTFHVRLPTNVEQVDTL
ncbi:MAG: HAMP domain-containing histidine kinase [Chloroflexi bacterium]|nr:HAMP domain-containing histidine kinase [Chloroflexota bacterium]